jgi:hypothetical protein
MPQQNIVCERDHGIAIVTLNCTPDPSTLSGLWLNWSKLSCLS